MSIQAVHRIAARKSVVARVDIKEAATFVKSVFAKNGISLKPEVSEKFNILTFDGSLKFSFGKSEFFFTLSLDLENRPGRQLGVSLENMEDVHPKFIVSEHSIAYQAETEAFLFGSMKSLLSTIEKENKKAADLQDKMKSDLQISQTFWSAFTKSLEQLNTAMWKTLIKE